jgi:hypothetical protein
MRKSVGNRKIIMSDIGSERVNVNVKGKCIYKGKAIPLQAWRGPEGPRRLRLPDFKTIGT